MINVIRLIFNGQIDSNDQLVISLNFQKEMFAAKVDGGTGGGGIGIGGVAGGAGGADKERKLSNSSATGSMKSKWVKAFKGIKGKQEDDVSDPR